MPSILQPTLLPLLHTSRVLETSTEEQRTYHQVSRLLAATHSAAVPQEEHLAAAFQQFIRLLLGAGQDDICFLFLSDTAPCRRVYSSGTDGVLRIASIDEDDDAVSSDFVLDVRVRSKLNLSDRGETNDDVSNLVLSPTPRTTIDTNTNTHTPYHSIHLWFEPLRPLKACTLIWTLIQDEPH